MTKQAINQHLARAEAIGDEGLTRIAGTNAKTVTESGAVTATPAVTLHRRYRNARSTPPVQRSFNACRRDSNA
ncbi:MAG: hypothetical protein JSR53_16260 [Proteobacteria bacterium]|nr:hypothetical protein [Pseudomonadota bacterium]